VELPRHSNQFSLLHLRPWRASAAREPADGISAIAMLDASRAVQAALGGPAREVAESHHSYHARLVTWEKAVVLCTGTA
jgi:hypothetical protein